MDDAKKDSRKINPSFRTRNASLKEDIVKSLENRLVKERDMYQRTLRHWTRYYSRLCLAFFGVGLIIGFFIGVVLV